MGPRSSRASAGGDLDPDHSRLAGGGTGPDSKEGSTSRGNSRRRPGDGDDGSWRCWTTRWASSPPQPETIDEGMNKGDQKMELKDWRKGA